MRFQVPYTRTLVYQRSFFQDPIRIWSSLPQPVVSCPTLDSFKAGGGGGAGVGEGAERWPTLDSYWVILAALYIVVLAIIFTLNVPASLMCQYDNTLLRDVCTLLEEEEE